MVGNRGLVDFGDPAFLGADAAREIAQMVDRQRQVRRHGLAQRLAVVDGLGHREQAHVLFHAVGDAQQDAGAFRHGRFAPGLARRMGGVQRGLHVGGVRARNFAEHLSGDRRQIVEIAPGGWRHPAPADVVLVVFLVGKADVDAKMLQVGHIHVCLLVDKPGFTRTGSPGRPPRRAAGLLFIQAKTVPSCARHAGRGTAARDRHAFKGPAAVAY